MNRPQTAKKNGGNAERKIVFLFSGQGSHYRGMGKKLYQNHPVFTNSLNQSDAFIYQHIGQSLIEELYRSREGNFDDLLLTHPAIVAVELAMLEVMNELGIDPDYVAGNSLGEFAAGVASGIWAKEIALEAAIEQAKSIVQGGVEGGMLAVIDASEGDLRPIIDRYHLYIASRNFPGHFTLSGERHALDGFQEELKRLDIQFSRLAVGYPFHCPLIEAGKTDFAYYSYTAPPLDKPSGKFISGVFGRNSAAKLPAEHFWNVVREPIEYARLVNFFEAGGPCLYIDLGPSGTSATFFKYNLSRQSDSVTFPVMTPYKREEAQLRTLQELLKVQA